MTTKLQHSFGATYLLLDRPRIARRVLAFLLLIQSLLLGYSAYVHSPTLDEPGQLIAGLSHWKFAQFELYSVDPPLVRMLAALPVIAAGYKEDWSVFHAESPGPAPVFGMGGDFVAANGKRSYFLFMIARWVCIPLSWIGAIVCYLWARDIYGRPSGILAAMIWCFEPNILAHGSLITPDAGATALGFAACYMFWRWLQQPTWHRAALTGIVLGLAELCKSTLVLFYLLWPLMYVLYLGLRPDRSGSVVSRESLRQAWMLLLSLLISLCILNLAYHFEGSFKQLKNFHFASDLLTGAGEHLGVQGTNRFSNTWLGQLPIPLPMNYLLGIDKQKHDFEYWNHPAYVRGQWRGRGWWYYYLYAAMIKGPLALWLLGFLGLLSRLNSRFLLRQNVSASKINYYQSVDSASLTLQPRQPIPRFCDEVVLLLPGFLVFAFVSSQIGINEHMRYALPSFPFFFVWISCVARTFRGT